MVNDNPTPEPLPPTTGVHVYVTVQTPTPPAPPAAPPKLPSSLWGYAIFGFVVICAAVGYVTVQLLTSGVISIGS